MLNLKWSYLIRCLSLAICMLITGLLSAQPPTAAFTASIVSGCAPLAVRFTDQSAGDPKYWNWDFGNGQLSSLQNPSATYTAPGVYTVQLVVRNPDGTNGVTKTDYIIVSPSPAVRFTASLTTACAPATIQFTDQSSVPSGNIVSWNWEFGDGSTASIPNPSKAYNTAGYSDVSLTVVSNNGCQAKASRPRFIRIINGITPEFNFIRTGLCALPATVGFTNNTSGPGTLTYNWDFGDGRQSGEREPAHDFQAYGEYTVRLAVSSSFGCQGSVSKQVSLAADRAVINAPTSACPDYPVNFSNGSANPPLSSSWDFGDGTQSTEPNPVKAYSDPGAYTVSLTSVYPECTSTVTQDLLITSSPLVDFTADNPGACKTPAVIQFRDASAAEAVSWLWDFGDGQESSAKDPAHTYIAAGTYTVKLSITTGGGCTNTVSKTSFITITDGFQVALNGGSREGCLPLTLTPTATITAPDGVAGYQWDFGDGTTSTAGSPAHTYTSQGTYAVKLKVETISGCVDSASGVVRTGTMPAADFNFTAVDGCAGSPVQFNDLSSPANEWHWDFGDGEQSTERNPAHRFADTGYLTVRLTAVNNGCAQSISRSGPHIAGPVARFRARVTCATPAATRLTVQFENLSIVAPDKAGETEYQWDFGESTIPNSTLKDPPDITYPATGNYTVTLTVKDADCSYTLPLEIALDAQTAGFTVSQPQVCRSAPFRLEASGIDAGQISSWYWKIGDGAVFSGTSSVDSSLGINGRYPVTLTIVDTFGCSSSRTVADAIEVVGARADFSVVNNGGCADADIAFTDQSTGASVSNWIFDYGNGTTVSYTSPPFTNRYADSGRYPVTLRITDIYGCTDQISKAGIVQITKIIARFGAAGTLSCPGATVLFTDSSTGNNLRYQWDFGDGGTATEANPAHIYGTSDQLYTITLRITDGVGCVDSMERTGYIRIVAPKPGLSASDTMSLCPPLQAFFNSASSDYESLYWDFGDGSNATLDTISHFYNNYGTYTAKLYTVGYGGCLDSAVQTIRVLNPAVDTKLDFSPLEACNSLNVHFTLTIPDDIRFTLLFGDGASDTTQPRQTSHLYDAPNLYRPAVALEDSVGCRVNIGGPGIIRINGSLPLFNMDRRAFCDNGEVFFTDFTVGNDPVVAKSWDFGDGISSPEANPVHFYARPDTYLVSQNVVTASGCHSSFTDTVRVYRTPEPVITAPAELCTGDSILLQAGTAVADTALSWTWQTGSISSTDTVLALIPADTGSFSVRLKAVNLLGCIGDTSRTIRVNPLPVITMPEQLITPVGTTVPIPVTYNDPALTYRWEPSTYLSCADCAQPEIVTPRFSTTYRLTVTDAHNCIRTDSLRLVTVCNNLNYFIPNTFSPNGDGRNDWFYPRGSFINKVQSLRIFNRWGEMVFEKKSFAPNSMTDGWNGFYKGKPAGEDVYVFILELICENAQIIPIRGNVTLIR